MSAADVRKLLRVKYAPPSWALLNEVRDGNGYVTQGRLMDAMAFGLWPSRGLEIHGFEIKVFRNDWLRELKQPEKAESFYKFVDRWYIVAGDDSVVKVDELPKTWGLMVAKGEKLRTLVEAPIKKATPVSRQFMMAIIRRVTEAYIARSIYDQAVTDKVAEKVEEAVRSATYGRERLQKDNEELRAAIADFEKRSGVRITEWNHEKIGDAVRIVAEHGPEAILNQYEYLARRMTELGDVIEKAATEAKTKLDALKVTA